MTSVYLHAKHHGQGIATAALHALLHSYMIPVLKARTIRSSVLVGNIASKKAQETNGFREIGTFWIEIGEERGGGKKECWLMEWRADV